MLSYCEAFARIDEEPEAGRGEIERGGDPEDGVKRTEKARDCGCGEGREGSGDAGTDIDEATGSAAEAAAYIRCGGPHDGESEIVRAACEREERDGGGGRFYVDRREIADCAERITGDGNGPAANDQTAGTARDEIGEDAAEEAPGGAGCERKRREDAGLFERKAVLPNEISGEPGDEELKSEAGGEVAGEEREHRRIRQKGGPGQFGMPGGRRCAGADHFQLGRIHGFVAGGIVAIPARA